MNFCFLKKSVAIGLGAISILGSRNVTAAAPDLYEHLNDRYVLSHLSFAGVNGFLGSTFWTAPFRIYPDGRIEGKTSYYNAVTGRGTKGVLRGQVTKVSREGDLTKAVLEARAGSTRYKLRLRNFTGQPDVVRGEGFLRFQGKRYRIKIDNQRQFSQPVKVR